MPEDKLQPYPEDDVEQKIEEIKEQGPDLTKERDDRCIPIVRELIKRLGNRADELVMEASNKDANRQDTLDYYGKVFLEDVIELLLQNNVRVDEVGYIFRLMLEPITHLSQQTTMALDMHENTALASLYGKNDPREITVVDVHRVLIERAENDPQANAAFQKNKELRQSLDKTRDMDTQ